MSSLLITIFESDCAAADAFQSWPLITSILSIYITIISFCISGGIHSHHSIGSLYVPAQCQIHVSKTVFCIALNVAASTVTWRKLPPAQLSKECITVVAASNKQYGVTKMVEWEIYNHHMKLCFEFSKMNFVFMPSSEQCSDIFFGT